MDEPPLRMRHFAGERPLDINRYSIHAQFSSMYIFIVGSLFLYIGTVQVVVSISFFFKKLTYLCF